MLYFNDHHTMLALQKIVQESGDCVYLEIGSLLGGSLVPYLLDPRCSRVMSVDSRPPSTPDERGTTWTYGATTAQMRTELQKEVTQEDMLKLTTWDMDTAEFAAEFVYGRGAWPPQPNLVFLDAEHTNAAVFQDFLNIYPFLQDDAIFAFHDSNLIFDALTNITAMLTYMKVEFRPMYLQDVVFALAFGSMIPATRDLPVWDAGDFVKAARKTLSGEIVKNANASV
jgi:Methyltransferase domain